MGKLLLREFHNGMTVAELKEALHGIPELNENGDPYEVWIGLGDGLSSPAIEICPLNSEEVGSDVLLLAKR
jgi:hypothetical protein